MKYTSWLVFAIAFFVSCSSVKDGQIYQYLEEDQVEAGVIEQYDFVMEIAYVGAIGHSYVFECSIDNTSDQPMLVDKSQFYMDVGRNKIIEPAKEELIVERLKQNQKNLKKQKRTNTVLGILGVGLSALAGSTQGLSAGETLLLNAEPIIYIFDDRRWYNKDINSIEDEIEYVRSAQFDIHRLNAGSTVTRDLLFPTTKSIKMSTLSSSIRGRNS